jgi:hypothetical protein
VRDQQKLHDPQSGLGTHCREHIGKARDALQVILGFSGMPGSRAGSALPCLDVGIRADLKRFPVHSTILQQSS